MNTETRQQIAALLHAGHSDLAIHRQTGAARTTIARYRKQLGLPGYRTTPDSPACRHGHPWPEHRGRDSLGRLICRECRRISARNRARRLYTPAEPDPAAIERAIAGDPPDRLTPRERHAAIQQLDTWQLTSTVIAERIRCSRRTVHRHRAAA